MPLETGARIGPYEILAPIEGANGSELYKASDTRDARAVVIRISNDAFPDRLEQEAQALASLRHPNICGLHDIGQEDARYFVVTEYAEGPTVAARLAKGALNLREAVGVAIQMADALDQAHRIGVMHRNLQPSKVVLAEGGAKLLDFGLPAPPPALVAAAAAKNAKTSAQGADAGLCYTAPECLEGNEGDARSDIFSFGTVLYEMVTGTKAFEGKSRAVLLAAIATADPDPISKNQPAAPAMLQHIVDRCLAKDPADRWQTAHDLLVQLRWMSEGGGVQSTATTAREKITWALVGVAALLVVASSVPAALYLRGPGDPAPFEFRVPVRGLSTSDTAISPDGQAIALVARPSSGDPAAIYVRRVGAVTFQRLGGTDEAVQPFWSPDSRHIAFVSGSRLKQVAAAGGAPKDISDAPGFAGGAWNQDGIILFGSDKGVMRVSAEGGTPAPVTAAESGETGHLCPNFLPDGRHFLYLAWSDQQGGRAIFVGSLDSKTRTKLMPSQSNALYAPGYILFHRAGSLFAQAFDAGKLALRGEPVHVADQVGSGSSSGRADFSVSQEGSLLYYQGGSAPSGRARILSGVTQWGWATRGGGAAENPYAGEPAPYGDFDLSPDGKLIAVTKQEGGPGADIWVIDWQRAGVSTRLTLDPADDIGPVWSPDGKRIAFTTYRKGNGDIYVVENGVGEGKETPLLETTAEEVVKDWSKDGRYIAYLGGQDKYLDIYALPLKDGKADPDKKPFPVVQGRFQKSEPQFSYDGKWLAYTSDRTVPGTFQVYVRSFPAGDQEIAVSTGGGGQPRWKGDGKELYYRTPDDQIVAVEIKPGAKLEAGIPHVLFSAPFRGPVNSDPARHILSVTPDGQRFLLRVPPGGTGRAGGALGNMSVPEVPVTAAASSTTASTGGRGGIAAPAFSGLTVIQHWPSAVKKEAR